MHSESNQSFTNRERKETTQRLRRESKKRRKISPHTHIETQARLRKEKKKAFAKSAMAARAFFVRKKTLYHQNELH